MGQKQEEFLKELMKKGNITKEEAEKMLASSTLNDEELRAVFQEAEEYKEKIQPVDIDKIPSLVKEAFDLEVKIKKLAKKYSLIMNGRWFDKFVRNNFNAIKQATDELNKRMGEKTDFLAGPDRLNELAKLKGENFDPKEINLENDLALYKYKKTAIKEVDKKFKVTEKMREDFQEQINKIHKDKTTPIAREIDELREKVTNIELTISKTLFISLEEAKLMILSKNFFSMIFEFIAILNNQVKDVNIYDLFKETISKNYKIKQVKMQSKFNEIREKREKK